MQHFSSYKNTSSVVKTLIWLVAGASFLYPIITYFLVEIFKIHSLAFFFPLSWVGIKAGFFWQLVSYFFINSIGTVISVGFLISLFFNLFLLWFAGNEIVARYGTLRFLLFYLGAGIFAGLIATLYFFLFSRMGMIASVTPPIYALLTLWSMLFPRLTLHLLVALPISTKWIIPLLLAISLLFNLLSGGFVYFLADLAAVFWGYCIGRLLCKL